jgi:serine/threonine protein kinase
MRENETKARTCPDPVVVGPFEVVGVLGAGAMGRVYLGRSSAADLVAVKVIRPDLAQDAAYRRRFAREIQAARRVRGPFTAAVVDADPQDETPWLATEYIAAPSLAAILEDCGPLGEAAVLWLAAGCARALHTVHGAGLVHRDVKPANILVGRRGPVLIDFGLAYEPASPLLTTRDASPGTPGCTARSAGQVPKSCSRRRSGPPPGAMAVVEETGAIRFVNAQAETSGSTWCRSAADALTRDDDS